MERQIAKTCKQIAISSFIVGFCFIILNLFLTKVTNLSLIYTGIGIGIGICIGALFIYLFGICFSLMEIYTENVAEVELKQLNDIKKLTYKKWRRY